MAASPHRGTNFDDTNTPWFRPKCQNRLVRAREDDGIELLHQAIKPRMKSENSLR